MILRPYQIALVDDLTAAAHEGHRRLMLQSFMGSGKTCIAADIIRHATSNNKRCIFLAPRREIIWQTVKKLEGAGVECGVMQAGEPYDYSQKAIVASIQTFYSWVMRRNVIKKPNADLVVIDEAHHIQGSKTWQKIAEAYPNAFILGMSATPVSKTGKGLGAYFDKMECGPTVKELTDQGYLVPVRYYCPSLPDLQKVHVRQGDYVEGELEEAMNRPKLVGEICENFARICPDRQALVFASGIKHSIHLANEFNSLGVKAAHVDGDTPSEDRDKIIEKYRAKEIQVLTNCSVYAEGTDIPEIGCLIFARPTKSLVLYLQVAGRALRPAPGKKNCVFLDHSGVLYEHGLIDQDWQWQLEYLDGEIGTAMKRKKKKAKPITCLKCKCVYESRLDCPNCGTCPTINGKAVPTYEALLQELNSEEIPKGPDKKLFYQELLGYAFEKGHKRGWAWFKYQDKFGIQPGTSWIYLDRIQPSLETRSWIRSRQIAWVKSKKNSINREVVYG